MPPVRRKFATIDIHYNVYRITKFPTIICDIRRFNLNIVVDNHASELNVSIVSFTGVSLRLSRAVHVQ